MLHNPEISLRTATRRRAINENAPRLPPSRSSQLFASPLGYLQIHAGSMFRYRLEQNSG